MSTINGSTATIPPMTMPAASSNAAPVSAAVNPAVSSAAPSPVASSTAAATQVALSPESTSAAAAANANAGVNGVTNTTPAQVAETPQNVVRTGTAQNNRPLNDAYVDKINTKHISQQQADSTLKHINPNQKEELLSRSIERLSTEISKNQKQISNTVNAYSMIQVANDSLDEIQGGLKELQKLIQGTSGEPKEDQTNEDFLAQQKTIKRKHSISLQVFRIYLNRLSMVVIHY